ASIVSAIDGEWTGEIGEAAEPDMGEGEAVAEGVLLPQVAAVVGGLPVVLEGGLRSEAVRPPADGADVELHGRAVDAQELGVQLLGIDAVVEIGIAETNGIRGVSAIIIETNSVDVRIIDVLVR